MTGEIDKNLLVSLLQSTKEIKFAPDSELDGTSIEGNKKGEKFNITWYNWQNKTSFLIQKSSYGITDYEVVIDINPESEELLNLQHRTETMKDFSNENFSEELFKEIKTVVYSFNS